MMEQTSILVGKCYRDASGVVYEITSYDGEHVQFIAHPQAGAATTIREQASEPWQPFLQKLQGEVSYPQS